MAAIILSLLFLTRVLAEDVATPSSLLGPRNFNHHVLTSKYLRALESPETTKQGPVLFPNDAPPPPRPPLIVTSRPLIESIARSELNPEPQNNTIPQPTQISNVIKPFLARTKDYRPFAFSVATPAPDYDYEYGVKRGRDPYEDYEQRPALPPIYKVIAENAKQRVAKIKQHQDKHHDYKAKGPEYYHHRNTNDGNHIDDEEGKNYAFSYRVKDQKTGDDFSHSQQSSGSATNGEYRVRLPDGRMQIVSYTADENGYQADVRYADDEDKTAGNNIDHQNDNHNHYNQFNDNYNKIDSQNYKNNNLDTNYDNHDNYINSNQYSDFNQNQYNDRFDIKNDYIQHADYKTDNNDKYKPQNNNDYYNQYSDNSKEYYNDDFSKEYESKSYDYAPHTSKFSSFIDNNENTASKLIQNPSYISGSTVKPSYEELKDLLVTKQAYNTVQPPINAKIPVTISVPSTTPGPFTGTTERIVLIGGKKSSFYTNIRNVPLVSPNPIIVTPSPISPVKYVTSSDFSVSPTPASYLVSTINSLRNRVDLSGPKPVLSNSYIDRINKYLSFN